VIKILAPLIFKGASTGNNIFQKINFFSVIIKKKLFKLTIGLLKNELPDRKDLYEILLDSIPEPKALYRNDAAIACNKALLDMLGYRDKSEILGKSKTLLAAEMQADGVPAASQIAHHDAIVFEQGKLEIEWLSKKKSGEIFPSTLLIEAIPYNGEKLILATLCDNTKKQMQKELTASEYKFETIFNNSNDAIILYDGKKYADCNPQALEMFGYPDKKSFLNTSPADISAPFQPDGSISIAKGLAYFNEVFEKGRSRFDWLHRRTDGKLLHTDVLLTVFELYEKKYLMATIRDMTDRKLVEKELQKSEERYRLLADLTFEGILIHEKGVVLDVNLSFCNMFGYEHDELMGKNAIDMIIHDDHRYICYANSERQYTQPYEVLSRKKNGDLMWVEIIGKPYRYNDKTIRALSTRDISDRKMMEHIVRRNEEKFRRITESSLNVLIITDDQKVIRYASPSITRYTGFRPADLVGKEFKELLPDEMAASTFDHLALALHGKKVKRFETAILKKNHTHAYIEASIVRVITEAGRTELEIYMRDITEQKKLEQEIIKLSERERRHIGQNIHDGLGQTLTGISIMIGAVAKKVKLNKPVNYDEMIKIAEKVEGAIETTWHTVRGLYPVAIEKGGLVSGLREMAMMVEHDYNIKCTVASDGLETARDLHTSTQLYYIAREAVNNAIKHGGGGAIEIIISLTEKKINLSITNEKNAVTKKTKRNGMGLKIMRYRAGIIGATFRVKSKKDAYKVEAELQYQS